MLIKFQKQQISLPWIFTHPLLKKNWGRREGGLETDAPERMSRSTPNQLPRRGATVGLWSRTWSSQKRCYNLKMPLYPQLQKRFLESHLGVEVKLEVSIPSHISCFCGILIVFQYSTLLDSFQNLRLSVLQFHSSLFKVSNGSKSKFIMTLNRICVLKAYNLFLPLFLFNMGRVLMWRHRNCFTVE